MKEKVKNNWSKWIFFKDLNKLPKIPVVYQIRCLGLNFNPIPICRLKRIDKNGIIDIGHTVNLRTRMSDFWGAAGKGKPSYSHQAGVNFLKRNYKKLFPVEKLQFRYLSQKDKSSARKIEGEEIKKYIKKFFEFPPLNSQE